MFICQTSGGMCVATNTPIGSGALGVVPVQLQAPLPVPLPLSGSVGQARNQRGNNGWQDVTSVQRALNLFLPGDGGAQPSLEVDGTFGPNTLAAIQKFQLRHFGQHGADGLIELNKQTHQKINELLAKVIQTPPTMEDLIRRWGLDPAFAMPFLEQAFTRARGWISTARGALWNSTGAALLEKHFLLSRQPNRDAALARISGTLNTQRQFFQRPGGLWGEQAFQPAPGFPNMSMTAFSTQGGYFMPGQSARAKGPQGETVVLRFDTIYVAPIFVLLTGEDQSYVIVHELAHFVGRSPGITDWGYYHRGTAQNLSPGQRMQNADTFAMYIYESATGKAISPHR